MHQRTKAAPGAGPGKKPRWNQRGSVLLEAMISMSILAIGVLGLFRMQVIAAESDGYATRMDRATMVARDLLTYLESVPYDSALLQELTPNANNGDPLDSQRSFTQGALGEDLDAAMYTYMDDGATIPDALMDDPDDPCTVTGGSCLFRGYVNPAVLSPSDEPGRPVLDFSGDGDADFERYWIISPLTDENPEAQGVRISVIVRWYEPAVSGFRRVVISSVRHDPTAILPT